MTPSPAAAISPRVRSRVVEALWAPYALLRLAWRPLSFLNVTLALIMASLPFLLLEGEVFAPLGALRDGTAPPAAVIALWQALAFAPAGFGHVFGQYRLEAQHTMLSWYLPSLRRGLLAGTVLAMATVALVMAVLVARNAPAGAAVVAFAIACYAFLAPGFVFDAAVSVPVRVLAALPVVAVAGRPGLVAELARTQPVVAAVVAFALAAALLPAIDSSRLARLRPFRWSRVQRVGSAAARWAHARDADWRGTLATNRLLPWLRAAAYESSTRVPLAQLTSAAGLVLLARLVNNPGYVVVFAGYYFMNSGLLLGERMVYPLSRLRRAQLAWTSLAVDAVMYLAFASLLLYLSWFIPLPRLPFGSSSTTMMDWMLGFGCAFALAPIAQWGRIRWPDDGRGRNSSRMQFAHFLRVIVYLFSVGGASVAIERSSRVDGDIGRALVGVALLAFAAQLVHAVLLYQHYMKGDLVRAPS